MSVIGSTFLDDSFGVWLLDHQEYMSFIQMDWPDDMSDDKPRKNAIVKFLAAYRQFMKITYQDTQPQIPEFPQIELYLTKEQVTLSRIHFFLQWKIYRAKCKSRAKTLEFANIFVDELKKAYNSTSSQIINVNTQEFFNKMMTDSAKAQIYSIKDYSIVNSINLSIVFETNLEKQRQCFINLIAQAKKEFGSTIYMNHEIPMQEKFNSFIFNPAFVEARLVLNLFSKSNFKSPQLFTMQVVNSMNDIITRFEPTEPNEVAIFSILFFRAIFNFAMSFFPDFFFPKIELKVHKYKKHLTVEELLACQDVVQRDRPIDEVINTDPELSQAVKAIFDIIFMNSPLDILSCVHQTLSYIRNYAERVSKEFGFDAQSFDAVFGVFLLVIVHSEIPNYEEIFWFVSNFAPIDGLASPLEYAKATVTAMEMQISKLINNVISRLQ